MSAAGDHLRENNRLNAEIERLTKGMKILNQALRESQDREVKLRELLTGARCKLKMPTCEDATEKEKP
jgi:hypothetical protein